MSDTTHLRGDNHARLFRDKVRPRVRVVGGIRLHRLPPLKDAVLHHATAGDRVAVQRISAAQDGEIRQADFVGVAIGEGGHAKVTRIDRAMADVQFKIPAVVDLRPL